MDDWDLLPDEPTKWHDRFLTYLGLGPWRSLHAAYLLDREQREVELPPARGTPGSWRKNAERWRWVERAKAWDAGQHEKAKTALAQVLEILLLAGPLAASKLVGLLEASSDDQVRLAANSILNRIGAIHDPAVDEEGVKRITTIRLIPPPPDE